jgi:AcrR family transcriptional regulator
VPVTKGQETKTAILDDALRLASRIGFEALTIGQLAETTGLSKSGLFAHFRSKEQLQLQTLDHARSWFTDVVLRPALAAPRGEARLRTLFDSWLGWEKVLGGGCIYVAASAEYDDRPGPMRDALSRHQADWLDAIATVVGTAIAEGDFRDDVDPQQFAFELNALTLGYHQSTRLLDDEQAAARVHASFERLLACARP